MEGANESTELWRHPVFVSVCMFNEKSSLFGCERVMVIFNL